MSKPDNPPAFPGPRMDVDHMPGLTIRDYFAAAALQGMMATDFSRYRESPADAANLAYKAADAMLEQREAAE